MTPDPSRALAPRDLRPLFFPASVAVIGASARRDSLAGAVLRNLQAGGFAGALAAVHPTETFGGNVRAVPSVGRLDPVPDLAVWGIPAAAVAVELPRLLERGTRAHILLAAGFGESGRGDLERDLARRCRESGGVLLGPNCMGLHVARPGFRLDASFSRARPQPGGIVLLSQSGSVTEWILLRLAERGLGACCAASLGNQADLDAPDLLIGVSEYLPEARTVFLYLETVPERPRLREAVRSLGPDRRLLVLRGGRSDGGLRAVAGHTGALAEEPALARALLAAFGAGEVGSLTEAVDVLEACERLGPPPATARAGIVTNAGGPAVLAADAVTPPLAVPPLSEALRRRLHEVLPPGGAAANPVDALASASPETFAAVLERLDDSGEIDVLLPILMHPVTLDAEAAAASIAAALARARHPAAIVWMGGGTGADEVARGFRAAGVPVYGEPARAAAALSVWACAPPAKDEPEWPSMSDGETATLDVLRGAAPGDPAALERALEGGAVRAPASARTRDIASALAAAARIGFPVVLKVERPDVPHKAAAGLLAFADDAETLRAALERLGPAAGGDARWLVQARVAAGPEIYAACLVHPRLGAFVAVGRGGAGVEHGDPPGWLAVPAGEFRRRAFWLGPHVPAELRREDGRGLAPLRTLVERLARLAVRGETVMAEVNPAIWNRERNVLQPVDCRWQAPG